MYYNHYCIFRICNLINSSSSSQHGCVEYHVANNVDISSIISGADETLLSAEERIEKINFIRYI